MITQHLRTLYVYICIHVGPPVYYCIVTHYSSELVLPWDPLAESYQTMAAAQRSVVCLQCPLVVDEVGPEAPESPSRELFQKDAAVKVLGMMTMGVLCSCMNTIK